jgi:uncharacterized protein YcbK (DUF882 family)
VKRPAVRNQFGRYLLEDGTPSHFTRSEFYCHDGCGLQDVASDLIDALEALRGVTGSPIHVVSGCRCAKHNKAVGGALASRHLPRKADGSIVAESGSTGGFCDAADIAVRNVTPAELYRLALRVPALRGIGLYPSWIHVDTRPGDRVVKPVAISSAWRRG